METKKTILIDTEVIQNVANYLATRPFNEVVQLIGNIERSVNEHNKPEKEITTKKPALKKAD